MDIKHRILLMVFSLLVFCAFVGTASAADIYVPDNYTKIQWAIDNATVGDTINKNTVKSTPSEEESNPAPNKSGDKHAITPDVETVPVSPQSTKQILFIHDDGSKASITNTDWDGYSDLAAMLEELSFTVVEQNLNPITLDDLAFYDVVVFSPLWPSREISFSEAEALATFVQNGGRLFLIGEYGLAYWSDEWDNSVNMIGRYFGIELEFAMLCDPTDHYYYYSDPDGGVDMPFITDINHHEVTDGISKFMIPWGTSLQITSPAVAIAYTDSDAWLDTNSVWNSEAKHWECYQDEFEAVGSFPVLAVSRYGSGKVVAIGESGLFVNDWLYNYDHYDLAQNIFEWLSVEDRVHNIETGGNFSTIQAAIYAPNTTHGHIITVDPGTYNENVNVNKSLTIRSTSGNPADTIVQAASSNDHIFEVTADYVNISGFTVTGASNPYIGIYLDQVIQCDISDNIVSNNFDGIYLSYSSNNTITGNSASNNSHGIYLGSSGNNTISGNDASDNDFDGIYLGGSFSNNITGNTASNNSVLGIDLVSSFYNTITGNTFVNDGLFVYSSYQNTVEDNTVNGKPLVYLEDATDNEVTEAGQVILVNCSNITVENLDLSNTSVGIELAQTEDSVISNNTFTKNDYAGIYLSHSSNNTITGNTASNNDESGIYFYKSSNNKIYFNNFINNTDNVYSLNSNNIWNSTGPITYQYEDMEHTNYLGNYWDDYTGSDADGDGIGDTAYVIPNDNDDSYPLMEPWENYAPPENHPPIAQFTCFPPNPAINETVTFNASESYDLDGFISLCEFEFGDDTNGTGEVLTHAYSSVRAYTVNLTVTDNEGATNRTSQVIRVFPDVPYFDTEPGTYPSISGTHNGTIIPTHTVNVSEIFIYPCTGTGGHIEYAKIWNSSWEGAEAQWHGYVGDWHNLLFDKSFTLVATETYNYTITTGSYPQIHHKPELITTKGWITCSEFVDANGKKHYDWIPAIRLWAE